VQFTDSQPKDVARRTPNQIVALNVYLFIYYLAFLFLFGSVEIPHTCLCKGSLFLVSWLPFRATPMI